MRAEINIAQINMLADFYDSLSTADKTAIITKSFRKASRPLVNAAKANAPNRSGRLRRSIGTSQIRHAVGIFVGAMRPQGSHGHLIEDGTTMRYRKTKGGAPTGKVNPTRFFERAFESTETEIYNTLEEDWLMEIDKYIIRLNKSKKK